MPRCAWVCMMLSVYSLGVRLVPVGIVVEKVGVQVEGVDQIVFQDVDQVDTHFFPDLDLDGMDLVVERDGIDGVEIVLVVEIDIEAAHHHHKFMVNRRPAAFRIDDERAIQTFGNMASQWGNVAMVQMKPKGFGIKFVGETFARLDHAGSARYAIHLSRVDAVKVHGVGVAGTISAK